MTVNAESDYKRWGIGWNMKTSQSMKQSLVKSPNIHIFEIFHFNNKNTARWSKLQKNDDVPYVQCQSSGVLLSRGPARIAQLNRTWSLIYKKLYNLQPDTNC